MLLIYKGFVSSVECELVSNPCFCPADCTLGQLQYVGCGHGRTIGGERPEILFDFDHPFLIVRINDIDREEDEEHMQADAAWLAKDKD